MKKIDGFWNARMSGTNSGDAFIEMKQTEQILSGVARINDPIHGVSVYSFTGTFDGKIIGFDMKPDYPSMKDQVTKITVNKMPLVIETPSQVYGNVKAQGELREDNTVTGKWVSTIGTAGTFYMWRDTMPECKPNRIHKTNEVNQAFIMMAIDPSDKELEDVLSAINRSTEKLKINCVRADKVEHSGKITDLILEKIRTSKYLICDISRERPNVYYELGYAHGKDKAVILIARAGSKMHFDIKDYNTIFYENMTQLEDKLEKRLSAPEL